MARDLLQDAPALDKGRSGRYGTGMIEQVAKLQSDVEYVKRDIAEMKPDMREMRSEIRDVRDRQERDFRLLFGAIITTTVGIASMVAKVLGWI